MKKLGSLAVCIFIIQSICYAGDIQKSLPQNATILTTKIMTLDESEFQLIKFMDSNGYINAIILNSEGEAISEIDLPKYEKSLIGNNLLEILNKNPDDADYIKDNETIDVIVGLIIESELYDDTPEFGSIQIDENGKGVVTINGKIITEDVVKQNRENKAILIAKRREKRIERYRETLQKFVANNGLNDMEELQDTMNADRSFIKIPMKKGNVLAFANKNKDFIEGIDLYVEPQPTIASAMVDTQVDPWALYYPPYSSYLGSGIGIYVSEAYGCPDDGYISNYYRLSGSNHYHAEIVTSVVREVSPNSYIYCRDGGLPNSTDLDGVDGNPAIYIENYSYRSYIDNTYHIIDKEYDDHVYNNDIAVFIAAGNEGLDSGYVTTPAKGFNIITVGNYRTLPPESSKLIHPESGYIDPETCNDKPEIVASATNIDIAGYTNRRGTSFASPHAAAFAADRMAAYNVYKYRPHLVKAAMLAGATDFVVGGSDKIGLGGINFLSTCYNSTSFWIEGQNSYYSSYDYQDVDPRNGCVDYDVWIYDGSSQNNDEVRIVISWLNRGTYVYNHKSLPLGMDLDLTVLDPNGNVVATSASSDNSYEVVNFNPSMSGYYRLRINRVANRDTSSKFYLGILVNHY